MGKTKGTEVRVRVTLDFDFKRFWKDGQTLAEIQKLAEGLVSINLGALRVEPRRVGKVEVVMVLSGGTSSDE